ncbi:hypothetical protein Aspvir_007197 [Aspergillus viridinutans]|uniref:Uncharacterized protein n=1 Tax=Aspergillus viridinutans TaxID=75553 RepID=A0A9P3BV97_ASPVI|nr:uncharacterized protein Aspvir_007197 [Aspergillus viridinutans]GIK03128.1 hypothetical protein Aspvir_007197 [Aspergillus viridinutans]
MKLAILAAFGSSRSSSPNPLQTQEEPQCLGPRSKAAWDVPRFHPQGSDGGYLRAKKISFACVTDQKGKTVPVNCTVLFEGTQNNDLGIPKIQTAKYTSTPRLQRVDSEGFTDLRSLDFTVTKAGEDDKLSQDVTLILDNFGTAD